MTHTRIRNIGGDMPLDRWDGDHYVHATGREVEDFVYPTNGGDPVRVWRTEYEDDATVALPTTEPEEDYDN